MGYDYVLTKGLSIDIGSSEYELIELVLKEKLERGDYTVSLADMAQALTGYGLACRAYKMDVSALEKALEKGFAPIIVHYDRPETHFALVLGMKDGSVITVDPARGMEALEEDEFLRRYSGIAMLVAGQGKVVNLDRLEQAMGFALGKRDLLEKASRMAGCGW
ncbi:MAG: hypothetical protein KBB32_10500 [Spirochaetia bacterium]|nr:hypothetical protein [Spirochaetia bacterium]